MARPTKYTPEVVKAITDAIRVGSTFRLACYYAGISEDTFAAWQRRYPDFSDAIKKAEGDCVASRLLRIKEAGQAGTWQADAWVLERRYPNEYSTRIRVDHNIRREAERIALEHGLNVEDVLAEAESIVKAEA